MNCLVCNSPLDFDKAEITTEQHYETIRYGLFSDEGIKEETVPTLKEQYGKIVCDHCGAQNDFAQGADGFFVTGARKE